VTDLTPFSSPEGVAVAPDRDVYVADYGSLRLKVIRADTVTDFVAVGNPKIFASAPRNVAVTRDGRHAYVTVYGEVSVIDTETATQISTIPHVGTQEAGLAITPDDRYVLVASGGSNEVSVIDTGAQNVVVKIPVGTDPWGVAIAPNGDRAYVTNRGSGTVSVLDL
jgi:YVTN family beta-propeller protein